MDPLDPQPVIDALPVPKDTKASVWDAYHSATNENDFQSKFDGLDIPKETKAKLYDLRFNAPQGLPPAQYEGFFGTMKELSAGGGRGIVRTAVGLRDLASKGTKALGLGELPDVPASMRATAQGKEFNEQGQEVEPSTPFKIGSGLETAGEFFVPGSAVNKGVKAAEGLGTLAGVGTRVLGEAASAGAVAGVQSGGDPEATANSAIAGGVASGAFATIGGILKSIPTDAVYLSRLKFPKRFQGDRAEEALGQAIDEGILISKGGVNKAKAWENEAQDAVEAEINKYHDQPVDINIVQAPIRRLSALARRLGKRGLADNIDGELDNFLAEHGAAPGKPAVPPSQVSTGVLDSRGQPVMKTIPGTPAVPPTPATITVADAQQAKREFNKFAEQAFGKNFGTSTAHLDKKISLGLMQAMEDISPDIRELNRDSQNALLVKNAIDQYVKSNHEVVSPRMMLLMMFNQPLALMYGAWSSPFVRSALAIAKDRAQGPLTGAVAAGAGRLAGAAQTVNPKPIPEGPQ